MELIIIHIIYMNSHGLVSLCLYSLLISATLAIFTLIFPLHRQDYAMSSSPLAPVIINGTELYAFPFVVKQIDHAPDLMEQLYNIAYFSSHIIYNAINVYHTSYSSLEDCVS